MCIINIIITECHNVTYFSALLYKSFCITLYNKLISAMNDVLHILIYLRILHIDNIKPAQHNIIHMYAFLLQYSNIHIIYIDIGIHNIYYTDLLLSYINLLIWYRIVYHYLVMFLITMLKSFSMIKLNPDY